MRQPGKGRSQDKRGAVLIEMAMVLPILLFLFVGIVDFGLILREYQILQNAAREGARLSMLKNYDMGPLDSDDRANALVAIQQRVISYLAQEQITVAATDVTVDQNVPIALGDGSNVMASKITVAYTRPLLIGN